jgi:hypothetical protein
MYRSPMSYFIIFGQKMPFKLQNPSSQFKFSKLFDVCKNLGKIFKMWEISILFHMIIFIIFGIVLNLQLIKKS